MTHSLLVWNECPENIQLYIIPNVLIDDAARKVLEEAHSHYVNTSFENEAVQTLSAMLADEYNENNRCWSCYLSYDERTDAVPGADRKQVRMQGSITNVYVAGFAM